MGLNGKWSNANRVNIRQKTVPQTQYQLKNAYKMKH
jgi:hypothetical protein